MSVRLKLQSYDIEPASFYAARHRQTGLETVKCVLPGIEWSYLASRHQDVAALFRDPRLGSDPSIQGGPINFKQARFIPKGFRAWMNNIVFADQEDHTRLRKLVAKAFKNSVVQEFDGRVIEIIHGLIDQMELKEHIDFIEDFAVQLPLTVISEIMGIPIEKSDEFRPYANALVDNMPQTFWELIRQFKTYTDLHKFFAALIEDKRANPGHDLTSALIAVEEDGDKLNPQELVGMLMALLAAGYETTVTLLGSGMLALLENSDQLEAFKVDMDLCDTMVEELLRYTTPVHWVAPRFAKESFVYKGQTIEKGENIMLLIGAANRDPDVFDNPESLEITRAPNKHFSFGSGAHFCIGAQLARLEAKHAFKILFERHPDIKLAIPAHNLKWRKSKLVRGLEALPLRLS